MGIMWLVIPTGSRDQANGPKKKNLKAAAENSVPLLNQPMIGRNKETIAFPATAVICSFTDC